MTESFTSNDLQTLFAFPFKDPQWKNKFLIGFLLMLAGYVIPIVPFMLVYGYCAQIMRRIIVEGGQAFLPAWDDWNGLFRDGVKLFGVTFVFNLPVLLLFCGGYGLFITVMVGTGLAADMPSTGETGPALVEVLPFFGTLTWLVMMGLGMLAGLAVTIVLPVISAHVVATGEFGAAYRVREWWAIFRANLGGYLFSYVLIMGAWMVLTFVVQLLYFTVVLCCLTPFVLIAAVFYLMVIGSVLFAEAYRAGVQKLALPAA